MKKPKVIKDLKIGHVITSPKLKGEYIVVESKNTVCSVNANDSPWNAWQIKLQKLSKDGSYNHKAKIKVMYEPSGFIDDVTLYKFDVIRKLRKIKKVVPVKIDYFV